MVAISQQICAVRMVQSRRRFLLALIGCALHTPINHYSDVTWAQWLISQYMKHSIITIFFQLLIVFNLLQHISCFLCIIFVCHQYKLKKNIHESARLGVSSTKYTSTNISFAMRYHIIIKSEWQINVGHILSRCFNLIYHFYLKISTYLIIIDVWSDHL